jgi:hypothetical protein
MCASAPAFHLLSLPFHFVQVRELEGRLVGSREDPASAGMLPLDVVAAAQLAARLNLSVDDAKRVLMVKRQVIYALTLPLLSLKTY